MFNIILRDIIMKVDFTMRESVKCRQSELLLKPLPSLLWDRTGSVLLRKHVKMDLRKVTYLSMGHIKKRKMW